MNEEIDDIEFDILTARCRGLASHAAVIQRTMTIIHAEDASKEMGPFLCPSCLSEAIVRKCSEKVDHFAHKARLSPIIRAKDHELHETVSRELLETLINIYPNGNWAKDRPIMKNEEKGLKEIVPDLSGRDNNKNPIAIEIQYTPYTIPKIYNKTIEYQKRKIFVIWIVPLREELGDDCFRPRLFEKYLHSMYYGRVYYYTPNQDKKILPVHFSPAKRWIDETS
jgi:competence CoiA-like predicted nuclease